ncbi:MAG: lipoprotein-releasing ABC transporter permease subunit [Rickettsiales bacterium]|nr:lipoprotein-releasing ABC transporter permease subunit [Rickettsiales bacterium]
MIFTKLELLIALRYLKSKRKEGFISVIAIFSFIGIMIGVATLIIVMSVMNGFRYELVNRILGINSHISIYSYDRGIKDFDSLIGKISNIDGVKSANAIVESQAMLSSKGRNAGGLIKGVRIDDLRKKKLVAENIIEGDIEVLEKKSSVIVGSTLARNMNLHPGDDIKIISAETSNTIVGAIPRLKTYKVGGVFESGMYEYDSTTVFANFDMTQIHFRFRQLASGIEIFVDDMENVDDVKAQIYEILVDYPNLYITDWQQANASFIDALKVESTVMFLILTLIILVAAFNIISSMIMLVNDKNKNIALLRTLGMTKANILRIFLICGSSIGIVGTFLGFVIGVLFSANINNIKLWLESFTGASLFNPAIYFLSTLPSKIFVSDVVVIVFMSLILSILATIYPALKASKYNPAEILRYE